MLMSGFAGAFTFKVNFLMIQSLVAVRNLCLCVCDFDLGGDRAPCYVTDSHETLQIGWH